MRRLHAEDAPPARRSLRVMGYRAELQHRRLCDRGPGLGLPSFRQERCARHCIMAATDRLNPWAIWGTGGCVMASSRAVLILGRRASA